MECPASNDLSTDPCEMSKDVHSFLSARCGKLAISNGEFIILPFSALRYGVDSNQAIFCPIEATGYAPLLMHIVDVLAATILKDFQEKTQNQLNKI